MLTSKLVLVGVAVTQGPDPERGGVAVAPGAGADPGERGAGMVLHIKYVKREHVTYWAYIYNIY